MRDYYAVLEVEVGATAVQIRRAYQRLARRYSPDVNLWESDARGLFEEIAEAYRILSDPTARRLYDRQGARRGERPDRDPGPDRRAGRPGADAHVPVELSFTQAAAGVEVDVAVDRLAPCEPCRATGAAPGVQPTTCSHCGGLGTVWREAGYEAETCPACDGAGMRVAAACPACRGRGVAPTRAVIHAALPPGMDTGSQLRIPHEGHAGPFGGPRGDLIVIARVHEDPRYTRKGDNLYCEVPLSLVEAVLGSRIKVRGLEGTVDLAIPPGTQSGQTFRLRGKGVRRLAGEGRGDLYVTARVEIPRSLDARTQELFRELGRLLPDRPDAQAPGGARE
ncbi:MAG TPA: DnaJ C-terminal domain-containing protein [Methylomirabilota bacterium]|nr:DnaJ C-terminal domain-containing protein [Methylomirabilota bacterium]